MNCTNLLNLPKHALSIRSMQLSVSINQVSGHTVNVRTQISWKTSFIVCLKGFSDSIYNMTLTLALVACLNNKHDLTLTIKLILKLTIWFIKL